MEVVINERSVGRSELIRILNSIKLINKGETISIFNFNPDVTIKSSGLKYKVGGSQILFGIMDSQSNLATSEQVLLDIAGGEIFLVRELENWVAMEQATSGC